MSSRRSNHGKRTWPWVLVWIAAMVFVVWCLAKARDQFSDPLWHEPQARLAIHSQSPCSKELIMSGDDGVFWGVERSLDNVNWQFIAGAYMTNDMHLVLYDTADRAFYRLQRTYVLIGTNPPPIY